MLPSFVVAYSAGKPEVLFAGMDAGKAKEVYAANVENPKFDAIQLFVRPEYTRRSAPAKHVDRSKQKAAEATFRSKPQSESIEQPKRKATK
jgi:hypothetical protein